MSLDNEQNASHPKPFITIILKSAFVLLMVMLMIYGGVSLVKSNIEARNKGLQKPCYVCGKEEGVRKVGPYGNNTYVWLCDKCNLPSQVSRGRDFREIDGALARDMGSFFIVLGVFVAIGGTIVLFFWFRDFKAFLYLPRNSEKQ